MFTFHKKHIEASNTKTAQGKDVWNEHLKFLSVSAVCLFSSVCLLFKKSHLEASSNETAYSKDVDNEILDFLACSAVYLLSAVCLLLSKLAGAGLIVLRGCRPGCPARRPPQQGRRAHLYRGHRVHQDQVK